jgi:hypothetical protein
MALAIIFGTLLVASIVAAFYVATRTRRGDLPARPTWLRWRDLLYVGVAAATISTALVIYTPYAIFLFLLLGIAVAVVTFLIVVDDVIRKRWSQAVAVLVMLSVFVLVSAAVLKSADALRTSFRWLFWSHHYKSQMVAQSAPADGELRHIVWEATGFAGVANDTDYLVFDPSDSLSKTRMPGRPNGLPCVVWRVRRLERSWYTVSFYTDEEWGFCPSSQAEAQTAQ